MQKYFDLLFNNNKDFIEVANKVIEDIYMSTDSPKEFNSKCIMALQKSSISQSISKISTGRNKANGPAYYNVFIQDQKHNRFMFNIDIKRTNNKSILEKVMLKKGNDDNNINMDFNFLHNFVSVKFVSVEELYNSFTFCDNDFTFGNPIEEKDNETTAIYNNFVSSVKTIIDSETIPDNLIEILILNQDFTLEQKEFYSLSLDLTNIKKPELFSFDIRTVNNKLNAPKNGLKHE